MPSRVIREALDSFPCSLIRGYGQTEGTTMTFLNQEDHYQAIREDFRPERLRSCGREGFVTTVRIVDTSGKVVPQDNETPEKLLSNQKPICLAILADQTLQVKPFKMDGCGPEI